MISYIKGKTLNTLADTVTVLTETGVGYEVHVGAEIFSKNIQVEFYIHTYVKENEISLWGFKELDQLKLFKLLINISGVGARTASQLVTQKGVGNIIQAVQHNDHTNLKITGIGQKTAQKIILDLSNKEFILSYKYSNSSKQNKQLKINFENLEEAKGALLSLGYSLKDVELALDKVKQAKNQQNLSTQDIIRKVLAII